MKNVYAVTLSVIRHYGNNHTERSNYETPQKIVAENGDEAVQKAKEKVGSYSKPILEGLVVLQSGVE